MNSVVNLVSKKNCTICGFDKDFIEFNKDKTHKDGLKSLCRQCEKTRNKTRQQKSFDSAEDRAEYLQKKRKFNKTQKYYDGYFMKRFGITYADVKMMFDAQYGRCANKSCGKELGFYHENEDGRASPNRACVDHDHNTGKVRALLCMPCNTILGTLETKENIVLGLLDYAYKFNPTKDSRLFNITNNLLNKEK